MANGAVAGGRPTGRARASSCRLTLGFGARAARCSDVTGALCFALLHGRGRWSHRPGPSALSPNYIVIDYTSGGGAGMARPELVDFRQERIRVLHYTWIAFFISFYIWFNMAPLATTMLRDVGWLTEEHIKVLAIVNVALTIPARILVGALIDKYGPRHRLLRAVGDHGVPNILLRVRRQPHTAPRFAPGVEHGWSQLRHRDPNGGAMVPAEDDRTSRRLLRRVGKLRLCMGSHHAPVDRDHRVRGLVRDRGRVALGTVRERARGLDLRRDVLLPRQGHPGGHAVRRRQEDPANARELRPATSCNTCCGRSRSSAPSACWHGGSVGSRSTEER